MKTEIKIKIRMLKHIGIYRKGQEAEMPLARANAYIMGRNAVEVIEEEAPPVVEVEPVAVEPVAVEPEPKPKKKKKSIKKIFSKKADK